MISKRIVLHFPQALVSQPIISRMVKEHDLEFNILKANVTPREEGLLRALGAVALSARDGSAEPLDRRAAAKQVDASFKRLRDRYGSDIDVLKNAQAPGVDRSRVCAMTIALYAELVALPPPAAGQALRHVLGPAEKAAPAAPSAR